MQQNDMRKVRWGENLHRMFVESAGTDKDMAGEEYTVDLSCHDGAGECGCKGWLGHIWPKIRDGKRPSGFFDPEFSCDHITAARQFQYTECFIRVINEFETTRPKIAYVKKSEGAMVHSPAREEARQQARIEAPPIDDSAPF